MGREGGQELGRLLDVRTVSGVGEDRADEALVYQRTLFEQRTRLVEAQQRLQTKFTKKASEDERIAAKKVNWARDKLADLQRTEALAEDDRIYPGTYAPVMVVDITVDAARGALWSSIEVAPKPFCRTAASARSRSLSRALSRFRVVALMV